MKDNSDSSGERVQPKSYTKLYLRYQGLANPLLFILKFAIA